MEQEIDKAVEFFSREIGNQGLLYLLSEELEDINGRAGRLSSAHQEIAKWDDMKQGNPLFFKIFFKVLLFLTISLTEVGDLKKEIAGLKEYRAEVVEEIVGDLEAKEKKVNEILSSLK